MSSSSNATINLVPAAVQLRVAVGASVGLRLTAVHSDGTPFDLADYTVTAPFSSHGSGPPPVAGWAAVIEATSVLLSLSAADTASLAPLNKSITWHWDVWLANQIAPERLLFAHGDLGLLTP
jgi:hypothetical protein